MVCLVNGTTCTIQLGPCLLLRYDFFWFHGVELTLGLCSNAVPQSNKLMYSFKEVHSRQAPILKFALINSIKRSAGLLQGPIPARVQYNKYIYGM
jgi:hypothetical protein